MEKPNSRSISVGELLAASIVLGGAILSFWLNTHTRLTALEIEVQQSRGLEAKIDQLQQSINDIKLTLKDKQDRIDIVKLTK